MSIASSIGNIYFAYQFIKKLVTPFDQTKAYKLGIIDDNGKVLKKRRDLTSQEEKEAYTISDTLIFNLKKLLAKVPGGSTRFATFAAALFLLKEEKNKDLKCYLDEEYLFSKFNIFLNECIYSRNEIEVLIEQYDHHLKHLDEMTSVGGGAIHGIGVNPPGSTNAGEPPGPKKKREKFAGADVFKVDYTTFMKNRFGKKKYAKYEDHVGNDDIGQEIRDYGLRNPGKPIILQDRLTGAMMYLRRGKN
jgi:hypothetical protein